MSDSLYTSFVSHLIFPTHELMKGHTTTRVKKEMERTQWLKRPEIEALQLDRLKRFLVEIGESVPYYTRLFGHLGFDPHAFHSIADLQKLPFLSKEVIREHTAALKSNKAKTLARFNTGGSSGEPLIFYISKERVSHDVAAKWRATRWWDVDIGDREIVVWGSPIELGAQDRIRGIRDKLLRTRLLSAFEMSNTNLEKFVLQIQEFRPRMLFGYPSSLALIAKYARDRQYDLTKVGVKVAFVTSERLYPEQQSIIESVFGCAVANGYGGRDAGFIAHQCPRGSLHITAEDIVLETVDAKGRNVPVNEPGEIVVTHLATKDFPFVRYKTGDVGVLTDERCPCGRGLPVIKEIQGRTTDFVMARDGTILHGLSLIYVLRDIEGIELFKVVQESLDRTMVEIQTNDNFKNAELAKIREGLKQRLGADVDVQIEIVKEIKRSQSGKFRYIESKVVG